MLQKILVVLVGIVMSIVGALSPAGLFASAPSADLGGLAPASAGEEAVATVRTLDGKAFAKVSILWAEVDGRRVLDDAWGTGSVEELRFRVGVKGVEDLALAVGDRLVPLHPTDVLTVRMFSGDFAFSAMGTADATLALQGSVKSALVKPGESGSRVRTEAGGVSGDRVVEAPRGGATEVSYVVLDTGKRVDTVRVEDGGARLFTEEAADASRAADAPGNLLAKWVKVDGKLAQEYTWGDGVVSSIEFEPADAGKGGVVLAFNGEPTHAPTGTRVQVTDFVGEYLVYQVAGGLVRLRLDGYASDMLVGAPGAIPVQAGEGAPIAAFNYTPAQPKTTDTITFRDRSTDDTMVVLRHWRFGDEGTSVLPEPTFRFTRPGQYVVTLNVTDTDRQSSETSLVVTVGNAEPVPDFDFWPKIVTTDARVAFTDASVDTDGTIANWTWDFGDGKVSYERHPSHAFTRGGPATVTLTVTDELGGKASLSKVVQVRNSPPLARFTYAPTDVETLVPVRFQDESVDKDGAIIHREWRFGDGANATGAAAEHAFSRPGLYTVSLTVTDDGGDSDTSSVQIFVRNRLPMADFTWSPRGAPADHPVHFTSLARDPDGTILVHEWSFGDGTSALEQNPTHFFPRAGVYNVTLTVTDSSLERNSTMIQVGVANALPRAALTLTPNPAFRGAEVTLADVSTDPDGDAIVGREWVFGDGSARVVDQQVLRRTFNQSGEYPVTLTVRDSAGSVASTSTTIRVVNRPPLMENLSVAPDFPILDQPTTFRARAADMDAQPGDAPLVYEWRFSDGVTERGGAELTRVFRERGQYTVTVRAIDAEGARSNPLSTVVSADYAVPVAAFSFSPAPPSFPWDDQNVTFTSASTSLNGNITSTRWDFGDGTFGEGATVKHRFLQGGRTYNVTLTVTDERSRSASATLPVVVNWRPTPDFEVDRTGIIPRDVPVSFTDRSSDRDGDAIVWWEWNFGDGIRHEQHPVHNFTTPGSREVTLTVRDARGGVATATRLVRIENAPPTADFVAPASALAGQPIAFQDASVDPDGTQIKRWTWTFGDGGSSTDPSPTYAFAASGRYPVSLVVSDGETSSQPARRDVRVGANHPVTIDVRAKLPDGREALLHQPEYVVKARVTSAGVATEHTLTSPNGTGVALTLAQGAWMRGDSVVVTIQAPTLFDGRLSKAAYVLSDADGLTRSVLILFEIPLPMDVTLSPRPGERTTVDALPLVAPNANRTTEGWPVYRSMTEPFSGTGRVGFRDGSPIEGATVFVEARYLPVGPAGAIRDTAGAGDSNLLGWCRAATLSTDAAGGFNWTLDPRGDCALQDAGIHPVGRWEVRAKVAFSFAQPVTTDPATIYVDPTGGLLWSAIAPP